MSERLRLLVVDDSPVVRRLIVRILNDDPALQVVAEAADGAEAVRIATEQQPDVIVMDCVMPVVDGLEATRQIMRDSPRPIVLLSASYQSDAVSRSFAALEAGALTLVAKPGGPQDATFMTDAQALKTTVKLMAGVKLVRRRSQRPARPAGTRDGAVLTSASQVKIVAIAASTGGPNALAQIIGGLPASMPVPITIVQHITPGFQRGLVQWLAGISSLPVRLAAHGERLRAGEVVVAPADAHLGVSPAGRAVLSASPPIGGHRPSATHLFRSVASAYGAGALAVILTGMGDDGVAGLQDVKRAGGLVLAQDEPTSVVYGMPGSAVTAGVVNQILPIDRIALALISISKRGA
ncbi:MAG: chemotaxis-specific protein-glutamate methyltransferase CheB [Actinomycetota bacterium]|nr:chemotaxis-specific protein-glutamate methyltransferase CheB [Actinomycetota bacterium]